MFSLKIHYDAYTPSPAILEHRTHFVQIKRRGTSNGASHIDDVFLEIPFCAPLRPVSYFCAPVGGGRDDLAHITPHAVAITAAGT